MSNNYFQFKQFTITQNHSAMKVGTDGVLLGSWVAVENAETILDVGAGTGLLSVMLAQKSKAHIHAIEINSDACKDAKSNFEKSSWNDRLHLIEGDFIEYANMTEKRFDVIVSNPPYFKNALQSSDGKRNLARHANSLPHETLLAGVAKLLDENGIFYVVLPSDISKDFIISARLRGLHPEIIVHVFSKETDNSPVRTLVRFSKYDCKATESRLVIYSSNVGEYSNEYKNLTKDYYLAF